MDRGCNAPLLVRVRCPAGRLSAIRLASAFSTPAGRNGVRETRPLDVGTSPVPQFGACPDDGPCRPGTRQAMYGRLEGMYTKSQLMESLAEQKEHTLRLVDRVNELAGGLKEMEVGQRVGADSRAVTRSAAC